MEPSARIEVRPEVLAGLAVSAGIAVTEASPLAGVPAVGSGPTEQAVLIDAGLLGPGATISPRWAAAVASVAAPDVIGRVEVSGVEGEVVATTLLGRTSVAYSSCGPNLVALTTPAPVSGAVALVSEVVGESTLLTVDLATTLPYDAAWLWAVLVDARRRSVLTGLVELAPPAPVSVEPRELTPATLGLHGPFWASGWVADALGMHEVTTPVSDDATAALVAAGLATVDGDRLSPSPSTVAVADQLLTVERTLTAAAWKATPGAAERLVRHVLFAGTHLALAMDLGDGTVELGARSRATVLAGLVEVLSGSALGWSPAPL